MTDSGHPTSAQVAAPSQSPVVLRQMLRTGIKAASLAAPLLLVGLGLARGWSGLASCAFGEIIAVAFFVGGLWILTRLANGHEATLLAGALAVYLGQIIFLGVVIALFAGRSWLDGPAFAITVICVTLVWQGAQVVAFVRAPKPVYDLPVATASEAVE